MPSTQSDCAATQRLSRLLRLRPAVNDSLHRGKQASRLMVPAGGAPQHDEAGDPVLSRRAMIEDGDSWLELLPIHDADATRWNVVVACPQCGMRQAFRGTGSEIGDDAAAWKKGHQCATPY